MAANADASVIFNVDLDDKTAQKDLIAFERDIEKTKGKLKEQTGKQSGIKADLEAAKNAAKETEATVQRIRAELAKAQKVTDINASAPMEVSPEEFLDSLERQNVLSAQLQEQEALLKSQNAEVDKQKRCYDDISKKVEDTTADLEKAESRAGELAQQLTKAGKGSEAMAKATKKARKQMDIFGKRLASVVRSALIFTVITQALAKFRDWMGRVIKTSDEATAAVAKLKGALLTMVQPLVEVIIPAFTALVNAVTKVIMALARLSAWMSGTSVKANAEAAESLYNEAEALDGVGSAAKDAQKQLAGFDEINKLSDTSMGGGGSADTIAPDFNLSEYDALSDTLENILWLVLSIGAGLLAWKIASMFTDNLRLVGGIALIAAGAVLLLKNYIDAWVNGLDEGNFAGIIAGFTAIIVGLYLAFGQTAAAIGLVVGAAALLVLGIKDIIENGVNLQNLLMLIAGLFAAGLGISLLTGSWIPLLVATILGIIVAVTAVGGTFEDLIEAVKLIFRGLIDFLTGVFTGDWELMWEGIKKIFKGVWDALVAIVTGAVNAVIGFIQNLISWITSAIAKLRELLSLKSNVGGSGGIGGWGTGGGVQVRSIPALAQGAVIPANREFLAVLGDQKNGTNIEAPLSTIEQALENVMRRRGGGGGGNITIIMELNKREFGRAVYECGNEETQRVGVNLKKRG